MNSVLSDHKWQRSLGLGLEYALYFLVAGVFISNALTSVGVGAVLLVWLLRKTILREGFSAPRPLILLSVALFLAFSASLIYSEFLGQSLHALFLKYGKYLLLVVAIAEGVTGKRVAANMVVVLCLTATILCWDGFYQFITGRELLLFREAGRLDVFSKGWEFHSFRVTATFPAANSFASCLVPALMLGVALSFFYKTRVVGIVWWKGVCLGSLLLCLLLTFSRGGIIACLAGVLLLGFLFRKKILWIIPIVLVLAFLIGKDLYGNRSGNGAIDPTVETRLIMLKDATRLFRSHPWTGIGLNTYYKAHENSRSLQIPPSYAHNSYIQMIAEVGVIGFLSFLALMMYWFGAGLHAFRRSTDAELKFLLGGALAAVAGLLVAALFDNVLFELQPATLFWILMGYGVALTKTGSEK